MRRQPFHTPLHPSLHPALLLPVPGIISLPHINRLNHLVASSFSFFLIFCLLVMSISQPSVLFFHFLHSSITSFTRHSPSYCSLLSLGTPSIPHSPVLSLHFPSPIHALTSYFITSAVTQYVSPLSLLPAPHRRFHHTRFLYPSMPSRHALHTARLKYTRFFFYLLLTALRLSLALTPRPPVLSSKPFFLPSHPTPPYSRALTHSHSTPSSAFALYSR